MAKNKGGLIEDRVIRNPMEQMRRKLKFKAKKERKELRMFARQLKDESQARKPEQTNDISVSFRSLNQETQPNEPP